MKFSLKIQELKEMILDRFDKDISKYFKWSLKIRKMVILRSKLSLEIIRLSDFLAK